MCPSTSPAHIDDGVRCNCNRYSYLEEKRHILEAWSARLRRARRDKRRRAPDPLAGSASLSWPVCGPVTAVGRHDPADALTDDLAPTMIRTSRHSALGPSEAATGQRSVIW